MSFLLSNRAGDALKTLPILWLLAIAAIALGTAYQPVHAAGSASSYDSDDASDKFAEVNAAIKAKKYGDAITLLEAMKTSSPDDADVFNLLGFSNRKMGKYDVAFDHYQKALNLDPKHIRAHEYLGELYLQTDRLAEAEQQLVIVSDLCSFFCKEKKMLKKAIKKYKAANQ